jgi:ribosome-interacting GTPase 1
MDYPFTTQIPVPGMLNYRGACIQIVDTPAIVPDTSKGKGAGRKLLHLIRTTDAIGMVIDLSKDPVEQVKTVLAELSSAQILAIPRLSGTVLRRKGKGGIKFSGCPISKEGRISACRILAKADIPHAEIIIQTQFSPDELLVQIEQKRLIPAIAIANKQDVTGAADKLMVLKEYLAEYIVIDVNFLDETNLNKLKDEILAILGFIRVFLLEQPTEHSKQTPAFVPRWITVNEIPRMLYPRRAIQLKSARIWGTSVKHFGQEVSATHLVEEDDLIYLQS